MGVYLGYNMRHSLLLLKGTSKVILFIDNGLVLSRVSRKIAEVLDG
jgi:hypothetical protein